MLDQVRGTVGVFRERADHAGTQVCSSCGACTDAFRMRRYKLFLRRCRLVQVGMTEGQVTQIMGPPYSVISRTDGQMWVWSHANGMTGASRVISFKMMDGKVVEVPPIPTSFK